MGVRHTFFIQAGVGGLAAAIAEGLSGWLAPPGCIVTVEPETAACLAPALAAGRPIRVMGDLRTSAEMLSCGQASALAVAVLRRHGARAITLPEAELVDAVRVLSAHDGLATTPSVQRAWRVPWLPSQTRAIQAISDSTGRAAFSSSSLNAPGRTEREHRDLRS